MPQTRSFGGGWVAVRRGLESLVARYGLGDRQRAQLETILLALQGDERAPTAVRDPARAVDVHLADSLVALDVGAVRHARTLADVGAGAGFPGLALAVALSGASVSLVESQIRKCRFMEAVCAAAGVASAKVVCARAEEWAGGRDANDVIVARALAEPAVVLEYAAPLLRLGGSLVDWRGRRDLEGERAADRVAAQLGLRRVEIRSVKPFAGAQHRHIHIFEKVDETPPRFPRRPGAARKRPLTVAGRPDR